jgi:hypothetical protein
VRSGITRYQRRINAKLEIEKAIIQNYQNQGEKLSSSDSEDMSRPLNVFAG